MPYCCEKIKLVDLQDRRRKLTESQINQIKTIRETTNASYRSIAKQFGVSKTLINGICNEEFKRKRSEYNKLHWKEHQKKGEDWNRVMRDHRHHKYALYINGDLK